MHIYIIQIVHICTGDPAAGSSSFNPRCHQWRWTKSPAILLLRNIKWIGLPFFPTLTCGVFVFSAVSAPPSSRLSSHSHTPHSSSITHTHIPITHTTHSTHSHTFHSHMHHSHTHIPITHTPHTLTHISLTHTSHIHSLAHTSLTHTHPTHTSHTHTSQSHTPRTHTHITLGLRRSVGGFCVAGAGLGALQRGRMYALASLRCPSGVPPVSLGPPPLCRWLLRGRRGTWCTAKGTAMYQLSSFRLIACELIMACLFIVFAQVMMLVYGTWTTDMPRSKKKSAKRREDYIYIWTETYIIGFLYICRKHITISPYDHTHAQPRTHVHTLYVHRHAQHEHSTYTSSQHCIGSLPNVRHVK